MVCIYIGTLQVGKKIFSYVVIVGTPVGDVVSQFAPYYGEVGRLDAGQAVFPHLGHQDIVKRKEELVRFQPYSLPLYADVPAFL